MRSVHPRIGLNHQGFHDFLVFDSFAWNDNLTIVKNTNNVTLLFDQIKPLKNGASLILPSSVARNSSGPNEKRIFEILWRILEGRINSSAQPSWPCLENCQNGTFWSVHVIWNFLVPNDFIWAAMKVPFFDFIQKMSQAQSSSVQVLISENKLDYLNNPSQDFKNSFCLWSYKFIAMLEGKIREAPFFKGSIW